MIGLRVPLAPVKRSTIMVDVSDTVTLSCKSVSKMEIERIASSKVFGIFLGFCCVEESGCEVGERDRLMVRD